MKKIYALFLLGTILITGCSKQNLVNEESTIKSSGSPVINSAGDGVNDLAGYGYDATGEYANSSSSKFKVFDVERLKADQPSRVEWDLSSTSYGDLVAGENALTYSQALTSKVNSGVSLLSLFKGSINASYKDTSNLSSKYIYSKYELIIRQKRVKVNADITLLKQYLNAAFIADIQNNTGEYIVSHYGTHVLTDIILGAKLEVDYRSETTSSDRKTAAAAGAEVAVKAIFNTTTSGAYNSSQTTLNTSQTIHYRTIGGEPSKGIIGDIAIPFGTTIPITAWQNSSSLENAEMIDIAQGGMVPIYEFIDEPTKKAEVKAYYDQYLAAQQVVLTPDPVYIYYNAAQTGHVLTFKQLGDGFQLLGVAFYAFASQAPGTDPVYHFYNTNGFDRVYTINQNDYPYAQSGFSFEGIKFYAYKTPTAGALPVTVFYNAQTKNHVYTINKNDYPYAQNGYTDLGTNFYAIKK